MERSIPLTIILTLALAQGARAQQAEVLYFDRISDLQTTAARFAVAELRTGVVTPADAAVATGAITMGFNSLGQRFAFELEPNAPINEAARRLGTSTNGGAVAYRGALRDRPDSWARIVVSSSGLAGLVWDGATLYGIEPPADSLVGGSETTMFRLDDVYVPPGTMSCGADESSMTGGQMFASLVTEVRTMAATGATQNLDIGAVADVEFSQAHADPAAAMLTRLNNVDGIFSQQVGVQITVQEVEVFTAETDPFTTSNASDLLEELAIYRGATPAQDALGLTHLFTGRNLDGSTVGVAYFGALCSRRSQFDPLGRSFGAGLTSTVNNIGPLGVTLESLVAAHEIGHNFGAPHDGDPDDPCASTPETFLMAPSLNGNNQFSACSIEQMEIEIATASCITGIDFVDVALSADTSGSDPLAGVEFDYTVTATNIGAAEAASVSVELTFDSELEVIAITPAAGSCSPPQASVTCDLGALPGSTSRAITARLRSAAAGDRSIAGTATASGDVAMANDSFSDTVSVVPAVDLVVSTTALRIERNQAGSLGVTIRNLAGSTAQSVEVSATASSGLRVDSATLEGVACSVNANVATCNAASLTGLATASMTIGLTGLTIGNGTVSLVASAIEADSNPANNASTASIDVFDPPPPQSDGGGGSMGPWGLLALLGATAHLRRRRRCGKPNG